MYVKYICTRHVSVIALCTCITHIGKRVLSREFGFTYVLEYGQLDGRVNVVAHILPLTCSISNERQVNSPEYYVQYMYCTYMYIHQLLSLSLCWT